MVQWISLRLLYTSSMALSSSELWTLPPSCRGLLHFSSFHPWCCTLQGPSSSLSSSHTSHPTVSTCLSGQSICHQHPCVSQWGGTASSPQPQPPVPAQPVPFRDPRVPRRLQTCRGTWWSFAPTRRCIFGMQLLVAFQQLLNHSSVWGKTKLPLTSGITGCSLNYSWI